jgi:hypothetical protein
MNESSGAGVQGDATHQDRHNNVAPFNLTPLIGTSRVVRAAPEQIGLPVPGEHAVVRCARFQCLAFRDADGRWRDVRSKNRLPEVLEVVMRF